MTATTDKPTTGLLRIGAIARRAGVGRGTIQHYLREGLLPKPVKTFRNMAYYDPICVEQIRLIKDLQEKSFLPLAEIRRLLGEGESRRTLGQAIFAAHAATLEMVSPAARGREIPAADAAAQLDLEPHVVSELVRRGIATPRDGVFHGPDLEVLAALANLRRLGFSGAHGFSLDDVEMYHRAMNDLLQKEVKAFLRATSPRGSRAATLDLARSAVDGATVLIVALRKKSVLDFLESAGAEVRAAEARGKSKPRRTRTRAPRH